jgi:hypothetical protein
VLPPDIAAFTLHACTPLLNHFIKELSVDFNNVKNNGTAEAIMTLRALSTQPAAVSK